ncbi:hypothetical protein BKA65DRAFT_605849 [Rhexocercosporidium sp. MPI-PUGE-AT-0058]|nr:hypothetical protein BKA65DRAFT_605849 [Rhexocercosporidium sp. MPI-PUGE-AT-0058]
MIPFDFIAQKNTQEGQNVFIRKFVEARHEIVSFVDNRLGWSGAGEFLDYLKGSFNLSIAVRNSETNERVLIRFPFRGKTYEPWRARKVKNEVEVLNFCSESTRLPFPRVYHWGRTEESPQQLGPFIIEDFMDRENLGDILNIVYEQIAVFMLELSHLEFPRIGAISKDTVSGEWTVAEPPLTYDMNEVVGFAGFPADYFATMPSFTRSSDYFAARAQCLQAHLETQRNIVFEDGDITWNRYVARHCFGKLIPTHSIIDDSGPFRSFCDGLRPSNMLVDPKTMRITALLDFEFTNIMPAQFAYDLPYEGKQKSLDLFEPPEEQFIHAMERVEAKSALPAGEPRLSARMRESWDSKRFWFNLVSRSSFDVDQIYWEVLHKEGLGEAMLDTATLARKEEFLERKRITSRRVKGIPKRRVSTPNSKKLTDLEEQTFK